MYKSVQPTLAHGRMWCSRTEIKISVFLVSENTSIIVSDTDWQTEKSREEVTDFVANTTKAKLTVAKENLYPFVWMGWFMLHSNNALNMNLC
jgi:hypothetical protein